MGYETTKKFSGFEIENGSVADQFGELVFNEMYDCIEIIGKMHGKEVKELVEKLEFVHDRYEVATGTRMKHIDQYLKDKQN